MFTTSNFNNYSISETDKPRKKVRNVKLQTKPQHVNDINIQTNPNVSIGTDMTDFFNYHVERFSHTKFDKYSVNDTSSDKLLSFLYDAVPLVEQFIQENNTSTTFIEYDKILKLQDTKAINLQSEEEFKNKVYFSSTVGSLIDPVYITKESNQFKITFRINFVNLNHQPTGIYDCSTESLNMFAVSTTSGTINFYTISLDKLINQISSKSNSHNDSITCCKFSNQQLISSSLDGQIHLWKPDEAKLLTPIDESMKTGISCITMVQMISSMGVLAGYENG